MRIRFMLGWFLSCFILSVGIASSQESDNEQEIRVWGKFIDPLKHGNSKLENGTLSLTAPGPVHDLSIELGNMNAPRVLQPQSGISLSWSR